jgi:hypothetical protein
MTDSFKALRVGLMAEIILAWSPGLFVGSESYWAALPAHLQAHPDWLSQQPDQAIVPWICWGIGLFYLVIQVGLFWGKAFCILPYVLMQFVGLGVSIWHGPHVQSGVEQAMYGLAWLACGWVLALLLVVRVLKGNDESTASDDVAIEPVG